MSYRDVDTMTTTAIKERPILFSGPMVRAILEGRKTQTRRVAKFKALEPGLNFSFSGLDPDDQGTRGWVLSARGRHACWNEKTHPLTCPYGAPGDRLWVRETWWQAHHYPGLDQNGEAETNTGSSKIHYAADGDPENTPNRHYPTGLRNGAISAPDPYAVWLKRPSIFMPRWACRIMLEVKEVRVQRLHQITEEDARAEGVKPEFIAGYTTSGVAAWPRFVELWDSINAKRGFNWESNPWVWVVGFHRVNTEQVQS